MTSKHRERVTIGIAILVILALYLFGVMLIGDIAEAVGYSDYWGLLWPSVFGVAYIIGWSVRGIAQREQRSVNKELG